MVVLHTRPHDDFAAGRDLPKAAARVASGRIGIGRHPLLVAAAATHCRRGRRKQDAGCEHRKQQGRFHGGLHLLVRSHSRSIEGRLPEL
jgi:hypothetical protein